MVDTVKTNSQRLTREQIALVVGNNPRAIKLLESLVGDVSNTLPSWIDISLAAAQAAQDAAVLAANAAAAAQASADSANATATALKQPTYVTLSASADLANERVLTQGANIVITDGGAGNPLTVALAANITGTAIDMTIQPLAPTPAQDGGLMAIKGRDATATTKNGGGFVLGSGNGGSSAFGGDFTISSGGGDGGGQINVSGGIGATIGGGITFLAGDATGAGGLGAAVSISAGNCADPAGSGGSVTLKPGAGGASNGLVSIVGPNGLGCIEATDDGVSALLGFYGAPPIAQPTAAVAAATFVANAGAAINDASTFDGYTLKQVVRALRLLGVIA